jgi:hypothetical protein
MSAPVDPTSGLWREALAFARDQVKAEIDSAERLYNRSLKFLTFLLGAVAIVLTFLGWTTYQNLRDLVVTTTKSQMDTVVRQQIADQLRRENVEAIVRDTVTSRAATQLREVITRQVSGDVSKILKSLQPEINQTAIREARRIVAERMAPRKLSPAQSAALAEYLRSQPHKYMFRIVPMDGDPEEREFAAEIAAAFKASGWEPQIGSPMGFGGPVAFEAPNGVSHGVFLVVRNLAEFPPGAQELLNALEKAGIVPTVARNSQQVVPGFDPGPELSIVVVGPK